MNASIKTFTNITLYAGAFAIAACGPALNSNPDGGSSANGTKKGFVNTSMTLNEASAFDPGFTKTGPNAPGSIQVTISGETLGENGLPFNPVNMGDPQFVDGWNVSFQKYIVVVGNMRLSPGATQNAVWDQLSPVTTTPPSTTPYVIDVHKLVTLGQNGLVGQDGQEPAGGLFLWEKQDDGTSFDTSKLYAFSYDTVQATLPATNVNLSDDEFPIYQQMATNHWDKYIEATATYVGTCDCSDSSTCTAPSGFTNAQIKAKFDALPTTVHFKFGWDDHTSNLNCINPNNGNGDESDLANRGIQTNTNGAVFAQVTVHTDHVFWDTLKQEGTPLRMDHIAAWAPADTSTTPLDLGTLGDKPIAPVTFNDGTTPIPDRGLCQNVPQMGYTMSDQSNPSDVSLNVNGVPATNIKGLSNFMAFSAQSQMHLNANGLCYIDGQNAPDPWYVPNVMP